MKVAVLGATGVVGREMLATLERRNFPVTELRALASPRSVGTKIPFRGTEVEVALAEPAAFDGIDIALFSAGRGPSRVLAPAAAERGAVVVDNSSAWRMDSDVPLVVPEVNPEDRHRRPRGIIANPNCSTIQLVVALKPIDDLSPIRHIVVSTYQAASGKGRDALEELAEQHRQIAAGKPPSAKVFPAPLVQNLLMDWPAGDGGSAIERGYSEEELKLVNETRKIMGSPRLMISPTCVRVPVPTGHSESVLVTCESPIDSASVRKALAGAPGIVVVGDAEYVAGVHPQPSRAAEQDAVFVGRIRDDIGCPGAVSMWVVSDNLRKGAALNAVQIAELLLADRR